MTGPRMFTSSRLAAGCAFGLWLVVVIASSSARADVPALLPVQGLLTDSNGARIDGSVTVVFSIYDSETAGTRLHTESQTIEVDDGLFSVYLGAGASLDLGLFSVRDLWLGVQVGSDAEMTPRLRLGSAPFAAEAAHAAQCDDASMLGGLPLSELARATHSQPWSSITDVPSGLADGDDNTTYAAGAGLILDGHTFNVAGVTGAMIQDGTVTAADLAIGAVNGPTILDGEVGTPDLANGAVTQQKIASAAVGEGQLARDSVTSVHIQDGTITQEDLATGSVGTSNIIDGTIVGADISRATSIAVQGVTANQYAFSGAQDRSVLVQEADFHGRDADTRVQCCNERNSGAWITTTAIDAMVAPVHVPVGARIVALTYFYEDSHEYNITFRLIEYDHARYSQIAVFATSGASSGSRSGRTQLSTPYDYRDPSRTLQVQAIATTTSGTNVGWPTYGALNTGLSVRGVIVHYTVSEAD